MVEERPRTDRPPEVKDVNCEFRYVSALIAEYQMCDTLIAFMLMDTGIIPNWA